MDNRNPKIFGTNREVKKKYSPNMAENLKAEEKNSGRPSLAAIKGDKRVQRMLEQIEGYKNKAL